MTGASKRKGDRAELEAAALIYDLLGIDCQRKLGAGRREDTGDIHGIPDTVIQVCSRNTDIVSVGVVNKPLEAGQQARNADVTHAATFLRIRGGTWRVILTPDQWATLWREATP